MDLGLRGKVALVTASSQGLGRAVAEELAMEGASLILCARSEEKLKATCDWIHQRTNSPVMGVAGDLSSAEDVERIVREGNERYGQIEILVTNTGGPPSAPFEKLSRDEWNEAGRSLLTSVLELSRLVLPGMKERSWGRILNITSIAAKQPVENLIISTSLRAAVTGFAKSLADEVAPFGITVNNILPGFTLTERVEQLAAATALSEGIEAAEVRSRWQAAIPMKRLGTPQEFAALAAFLVSERASYITGTSVPVDGGWLRSLF